MLRSSFQSVPICELSPLLLAAFSHGPAQFYLASLLYIPKCTGKSFTATWRTGVLQPPPDYVCHSSWHHRMPGMGKDPVQKVSAQSNG